MTLEQIAAFAQSASGRIYRDTCERFGVDPAAALADDDFMAHQLRVALIVAHPYESAEEADAVEPDRYQAARDAAAKVKAMT